MYHITAKIYHAWYMTTIKSVSMVTVKRHHASELPPFELHFCYVTIQCQHSRFKLISVFKLSSVCKIRFYLNWPSIIFFSKTYFENEIPLLRWDMSTELLLGSSTLDPVTGREMGFPPGMTYTWIMYTVINISTYTRVSTYAYMYIHIYIYAYMYIHIYRYIHMYPSKRCNDLHGRHVICVVCIR
jgi:hypothetical protein